MSVDSEDRTSASIQYQNTSNSQETSEADDTSCSQYSTEWTQQNIATLNYQPTFNNINPYAQNTNFLPNTNPNLFTTFPNLPPPPIHTFPPPNVPPPLFPPPYQIPPQYPVPYPPPSVLNNQQYPNVPQ